MKKLLGIVVLGLLLSGTANAQCYQTLSGTFCPPPGGTLLLDWSGTPVCGRGGCTKDALGNIICSGQPQGYVTKDSLGSVQCTGGCVRASKNLCQQM